MKDFILCFIHSAKGGHVYFGHGYEYTLAELVEITRETITHLFQ
jgi:hypothetical protein